MGPGPPVGLGLPPGLTPPPGIGPIGMAPPPGMGPRGMNPVPMMDPIRANRLHNAAQEAVQRTAHSPTPPLSVLPTTDILGAAAPKKVVGTYRYTRGQEGILLLALNNGKSPCSLSNVSRHIIAGSNKDDAVFDTEGAVVRPGGAMVVIWQVPESMYMDKENVNLSIGLTRWVLQSTSSPLISLLFSFSISLHILIVFLLLRSSIFVSLTTFVTPSYSPPYSTLGMVHFLISRVWLPNLSDLLTPALYARGISMAMLS